MPEVHSLQVGVNATGATAGAAQASAAFRSMGAAAVTSGKKVQGLTNNMKFLVGGLVGFMVIRDIIKTMVDFEKTMRTVSIVTKAATSDMERLNKVARELGATTRFTATEAGEGMVFLARAGFDVNEVLQMIPNTLNLATAAMLDLGAASDMVANTIHQFQLGASETTRVVDSFMITANNANTDVLQLGNALQYAGTFAGALGVTLEETNAALGILADSGIKGSMGGTQMRGVFAALIKPTEKAMKALKRMGLTAKEVNPALNDLEVVAANLARGEENLADKTQFAGNMLDIFGRRPVAAALALARMNEQIGASVLLQKELAGEVERAAKAMEDTLFGSLKALRSAMQEAWLATGDAGFMGALRGLTDVLTGVVRNMAGMESSVTQYVIVARILSTVLKLLLTRMIALVAIKLVGFFLSTARAISAATVSMKAFTAAVAANQIGLIVTIIAAVVVTLEAMANATDRAREAQEKYFDTVARIASTRAAVAAADTQVERMKALLDHTEAATQGLKEYMQQHKLFISDLYDSPTVRQEYPAFLQTVYDALGDNEGLAVPSNILGNFIRLAKIQETAQKDANESFSKFLNEMDSEYKRWAKIVGEGGTNIGDIEETQLREFLKFVEDYRSILVELSSKQRLAQLRGLGVTEDQFDPKQIAEVIAMLTKLRKLATGTLGEFDLPIDTNKIADAKEKLDRLNASLVFEIKYIGESEEVKKRLRAENEISLLLKEAGIDKLSEEGQEIISLRKRYEELIDTYKETSKAEQEMQKAKDQLHDSRMRDRISVVQTYDDLRFEIELLNATAFAGRTLVQTQAEMVAMRAAAAQMTNLESTESQKLLDIYRGLIRTLQDLTAIKTETVDVLGDMKERLFQETKALTEGTRALERYRFEQEALALLVAEGGEDQEIRFQSLMKEFEAVQKLIDQQKEFAETFGMTQQQMQTAVTNSIMSMVKGFATLEEAIGGLILKLMEAIIQAYILNTVMPAFGFTSFASGGVVQQQQSARGSVQNFAGGGVGGIVNSPTIFPISRGVSGLMGEAGAEAIMPLTRMGDGKLGVAVEGGGGRNIIVNMNITTSDADSFRKSKKQIQREVARSIRTAAAGGG